MRALDATPACVITTFYNGFNDCKLVEAKQTIVDDLFAKAADSFCVACQLESLQTASTGNTRATVLGARWSTAVRLSILIFTTRSRSSKKESVPLSLAALDLSWANL